MNDYRTTVECKSSVVVGLGEEEVWGFAKRTVKTILAPNSSHVIGSFPEVPNAIGQRSRSGSGQMSRRGTREAKMVE